ncbi:UNVERIFIED_CONTAM: Hyaluronan synthase 3 [Siphonaria sp. JEL0065]|nr:Hyaluronan synthase 3 [Siphonaria sp. JEL0065]
MSLVFSDYFPQGGLNTSLWTPVTSTCSNMKQTDSQLYAFNNNTTSITQQGLTISAIASTSSINSTCQTTRDYISGRLHSNYCFQHGRFEAIAQMPNGVYTWPAIWLQCHNCTAETYFEIDLIETFGLNYGISGKMSVFYDGNTTGNHGQFGIDEETNLIDSFHNYTALWQEGIVSFYLNGVNVYDYKYGNIPAAAHLDQGCAVVTINLAIEGTGRKGVIPTSDELAQDYPLWTPLVVKSINVWGSGEVRCISMACLSHLTTKTTTISSTPRNNIDLGKEIPVAIAVGLFLLALIGLGLMNCSRLSLVDVLKALWTALIIISLLTPALIGYFLHWDILSRGAYALGSYGVFTMVHYTVQIICVIGSKVNRSKRNKEKSSYIPPITAMTNAVYREEPELFEACLRSLSDMRQENNKYTIIVADGQRPEEDYLIDVFMRVYPNDSAVVRLDTLDGRRALTIPVNEKGKPYSAIFVTQPWGGKREAMYTAMCMVTNDKEVEAILCTDSDTVFDSQALFELSFELRNPKVGGVGGECRIINRWDSFVAFISDVRYNFAFNIERACQSFHKAVVCISGPIGLYRTAAIAPIMDQWVDQTFFKTRCTYGDDRHLTNLCLNTGWQIVYTPDAFCFTASPVTSECQ